MKEKVLYKHGDIVEFIYENEIKIGIIEIVDENGTLGQREEPSYDIYIKQENCTYKHLRQSLIKKRESI